jgi:hypothetical protein
LAFSCVLVRWSAVFLVCAYHAVVSTSDFGDGDRGFAWFRRPANGVGRPDPLEPGRQANTEGRRLYVRTGCSWWSPCPHLGGDAGGSRSSRAQSSWGNRHAASQCSARLAAPKTTSQL